MFNKKKVLLLIVILIISGFASVFALANTESHDKLDPQEIRSVAIVADILDSLRSETDEEDNKVWPGYDISESPTVLTFENGHIYAFNLQSKDPTWKKLNVKGNKVLFSDHDAWGFTKSHMFTNFLIDNQEAFVIRIDLIKGSPILSYMVFVHERFHRYQQENFILDKRPKEYLDHLNDQNLALMQLEELLLTEFLRSVGKRKLELLKDFAAVNKTRRSLLQPASIDLETDQEKIEGLAEYVSARIFDCYPIFRNFSGEQHFLHNVEQYASDDNISDRAIKWRHYGVGAVMGYALDFLNVKDWKKEIEKGKSQSELLHQSLALAEVDVAKRLERIKQRYQFEEIQKRISKTIHQYHKELEDLSVQYNNLEGVEVFLSAPPLADLSGGGSTAHTFYMPDGGTLSLEDSSITASADGTWKISIETPFLFQNQKGDKTFKLDKETQVIIDGKQVSLHHLQAAKIRRSFHRIKLKGKNCEFTTSCQGQLQIHNGQLAITFN
jgi:hypothetical protein